MVPHLVFHSSSHLERSLRVALCFSSSLFFSSLATSVGTQTLWSFRCQPEGSWFFRFPPAAGALPMSPFSMARMSGLSLQSVRGSEASISVCSSLSCIAKEVKLYICSTRISQHPRTTLEFTQRQFQDLNNASHRRLELRREWNQAALTRKSSWSNTRYR